MHAIHAPGASPSFRHRSEAFSSAASPQGGFSIPAQLELLRNYAGQQGVTVIREFVASESAREGGRTEFGNMLAFLGKNRNKCHTILVEKADRLYRNIKDWVTIDELGLEVHFVKENVVLSPESRSSDQFIHGIKVLMARKYCQNVGEETLKGISDGPYQEGSQLVPSAAAARKAGIPQTSAEVGALAAWAVAGRVRKPVPIPSPPEPAKLNEIREKGDANR